MIGLLVDAAIAVVVVLDRLCSAVEKAARPQNPPSGAGAPPTGTGQPVQATSAGGHPHWVFPPRD